MMSIQPYDMISLFTMAVTLPEAEKHRHCTQAGFPQLNSHAQWIPAHTCIKGNEIADQLTKEGREKEQAPSHLSYREVKTLIHNKKKAIIHRKTGGYKPIQDALHQLHRHQQTTIFRLGTAHCRLNSHLKRIGVKTSAQSP